jgi:hypothetical protein
MLPEFSKAIARACADVMGSMKCRESGPIRTGAPAPVVAPGFSVPIARAYAHDMGSGR